jgi:hypothetical protein
MARKFYDDPLNISKKMWLKILNDEITDPNVLEILFVLLESNEYKERGGKIGEKLKKAYQGFNGIIAAYGYKIKENYPEFKYPPDPFNIPFLGEPQNGYFYWKLRPELAEALKVFKAG